MTLEPASIWVKRINSTTLGWSYVGTSIVAGCATSARRTRGDRIALVASVPLEKSYPSVERDQVLEDQPTQLLPRAWTSSPPSESRPSWIGARPRFSASAPTSDAASSSSLARNTTLLPPCTAGGWSRTAAPRWLKPLTTLAPVKARATTLADGNPPRSSSGTP